MQKPLIYPALLHIKESALQLRASGTFDEDTDESGIDRNY
jgi:hypothetical protein